MRAIGLAARRRASARSDAEVELAPAARVRMGQPLWLVPSPVNGHKLLLGARKIPFDLVNRYVQPLCDFVVLVSLARVHEQNRLVDGRELREGRVQLLLSAESGRELIRWRLAWILRYVIDHLGIDDHVLLGSAVLGHEVTEDVGGGPEDVGTGVAHEITVFDAQKADVDLLDEVRYVLWTVHPSREKPMEVGAVVLGSVVRELREQVNLSCLHFSGHFKLVRAGQRERLPK